MSHPYGREINRNTHRIILGVPGSGKTTVAKAQVASASRVVYFDPHGDYEDVKGATVLTPESLRHEDFKERYIRIVIQADRSDDYDLTDEFVYVARHCREARQYGGLVLVADEVGDYNGGRAQRSLTALHRNGHKDGVATILVSQRAVDIPLGCRATATEVMSLLQSSPQDLAALQTHYGKAFAHQASAWRPGKGPAVWRQRELWPRK